MLWCAWGEVCISSKLFQMVSQLELPCAWVLHTAEDTIPQILIQSKSLVVQQPCCYSCRGQKSCLTLGALSLCLAACVINHVLSSAWHFQPGFWGCGVNNFRGRISCGYKHNSWKQRVSGVLGRQGRSQRSAMLSRVFSVCR